jgi:hypothetical protein
MVYGNIVNYKILVDHSDSQLESSDAASTIKRWNNRWVPTEFYDSSGTTSTSEPGEDYPEDSHQSNFDILNFHNQSHGLGKSQGCLCQVSLIFTFFK